MALRKHLLALLLIPFLLGAAPSRTKTYTAGTIIQNADVTENEDNIFSYLQAGIDTLRANSVLTGNITDGTIVNADISSSAAVAYSKLNLTSSIVTGDITDGTILNADIGVSAAISYSKLNLTNSIVGTDIALGSDAQGDVMYYNGTDWARLSAGTSGYFLKTQGAGANPIWALSLESGTWSSDLAGGTRSAGVVYQNTGGKKRRLMIRSLGDAMGKLDALLEVGSTNPPTVTLTRAVIDTNASATNHQVPLYVEIPNNWYYKLTVTTGTLQNWFELDE